MTTVFRRSTVAVVGVLSIGLGAWAASRPESAASAAAPASALALKPPTEWISFQNTYLTPVADPVSRGLLAASVAFDAKDKAKAAADLREVSALLAQQAAEIAHTRGAGVTESHKRLQTAIATIDRAADDIAAGRLGTRADFDRAFNQSLYADLDRRWKAADVTTWYPVSDEPERHLRHADAAYAAHDLHAFETEIRKATAYLRLEAARADAAGRRRLDRSVEELDKLAGSATGAGRPVDPAGMRRQFARADSALAFSHEEQAKDAIAANRPDDAGHELMAGAHDLDSAAAWIGDDARSAAADAVKDVRKTGEDLASGGHWTRREVAKGLQAMHHAYLTLAYQVVAPKGSARAVDAAGRKP